MQKGAAVVNIFVSSTFIDLEEYRKAVCDIIRQLGAVDVAMEHLGARDERPKEECLRLVQDSDAFIGIYAHRYGTIPTGETISITEMEYNEAVTSGKRCLIYIVDENVPWQPKFIDVGKEAELLASFKKRLRENYLSKSFMNKDQLSASVAADLAHYFPFTPELALKWRAEQIIAVSKELSSAGSADKDSFEAVPPIIIQEPLPTSELKTEAKIQPGLPKVTAADLVRAGFRPDRVHMILSTQDQALKARNHRLGHFLSNYVDIRCGVCAKNVACSNCRPSYRWTRHWQPELD